MGHHFFSKSKQSFQRIAVRTYSPPPPSPPVRGKVHVKPKETKKEIVAAKPAQKKKENAPVKETIADEKILGEITKSLSNLKFESPVRPQLSVPTLKTIDPTESEMDPQNLVSFLQGALILPEFGEVVAKIEIGPTGDLVFCEILEARSKKNEEFLKKRLQELRFPCFNHERTFTITFRNVENI